MTIFIRNLVSGVTSGFLILAVLFMGTPAQATATPSSGPVTGGTSVTVDGIHFVQVSAGGHTSFGLTSEGTVYAWGENSAGQLGDGTTTDRLTPVQVRGVGGVGFLTGVTSIASNVAHTLAISSSGLIAWGINQNGRLGDGTTVNRSTPVYVKGVSGVGLLSGVTSIAVGVNHSLAATESGVFAWGRNDYGQLGDGTATDRSTPVSVALTGVTSLAAGHFHSLALTQQGVFGWGSNVSGQLGVNITSSGQLVCPQCTSDPVFLGLSGATNISAGFDHSFAIAPEGVYAWGNNYYGQLGDGRSGLTVPTPSLISLQGVSSIVGKGNSSIALTSSGLYTWGLNDVGQLGDGTTTDSWTPQMLPITEVTNFATGNTHSVAITPTGVYSWGDNTAGALGNGSETSSLFPVLGPNFRLLSINFGDNPGTHLSASGSQWSAITPAGTPGTVDITATANLFGGAIPTDTESVSGNAGLFTYEPVLAATGSPAFVPLGIASSLALLAGIALLLAWRSVRKS